MKILEILWSIAFPGLFLLVPGVVAAWLGWRGRMLDRTPRCAKCGCDLTDTSVDDPACPKCKADLNQRGAVAEGRRQRRWRLAVAGLVAGLAGLAWLAVDTWGQVRYSNLWRKMKPESALMAEMGEDPKRIDTNMPELIRRLAVGQLSDEHARALIERAMTAQADASAPWRPAWGRFVEAARSQRKDLVDDALWQRYWQGAVRLRLLARQRVVQGEPLPLALAADAVRLGGEQYFLAVNCAPLRVGTVEMPTGLAVAGTPLTPTLDLALPAWLATGGPGRSPLGSGRQRLMLPAQVAVTRQPPDRGAAAVPVIAWQVELSAEVEFVPPGVETVAKRVDAALAQDLDQGRSLSVGAVRVTGKSADGSVGVEIEGSFNEAPVDLGLEVALGDGARTWPIGLIHARRRTGALWRVQADGLKGLAGDHIDVVFTPSTPAARQSLDIAEIWDGPAITRRTRLAWPTEEGGVPLPGAGTDR